MRHIFAIFLICTVFTGSGLLAQTAAGPATERERPPVPETPPGSSDLPNLTGIWHRKGPLNGKQFPAAVLTNRAAGFEKAFDDAYNPTYDCSATPIPGLIADNYDF